MTFTWPHPIQDLLAPLEDFDRLHTATLRRHGHRVVDLSYPNPRTLADPRPFEALAKLATHAGPNELRYPPFGGFTTTRRRVAAALTRRHGLPYSHHDILMTSGATAAITLALQTLFRPGDRVLVPAPCWMDYPLYMAHLGIGWDLVATDRRKRLDSATIEQAWTPQTRGVFVSQPASPTGVVYPRDEIAALTDMLHQLGARHGQSPILISDETHRDQIWADDSDFDTPLTSYRNAISIYSFGKAWQMQGQRIGYLAIHPHHPRRELLHRTLTTGLRITGTYGPTALMQHLAAELADHIPDLGPLRDLQQRTRARLREAGYDVVQAYATPFVYIRVPNGDEIAFTALTARRGVLVMPSTVFHERGYFRLAINTDSEELERALDILGKQSTAAPHG